VRKRSRVRLKVAAVAVAVALAGAAVYMAGGKTETVLKEVPELAPGEEADYRASVTWPLSEADQSGAGAASGVAVDSQGYLYYLHRAGYAFNNDEIIPEPTIVKLDPASGEVLAEFGAGVFQSPHGLTVAADGSVWVTDVQLNEVIKLSAEGEVLRRYGKQYPFYMETMLRLRNVLPRLPVPQPEAMFARPTDVVVTEQGEFIVADGYRNKRVAKFTADGELVWQLNADGSGDGQFNLPHGLSADRQGRLYVADRKNARIQVLSPDGEWLASWDGPELGRPYGVEVGADGYVYAVDGGDALDGASDRERSRIVKLDAEGRVVARWGSWGEGVGQMRTPHDIAVDASGNVYVADLDNNRVQRYSPER